MPNASKRPHATRKSTPRRAVHLSPTDTVIFRLARRKRGVCGREIMDALNWRSASAKIEVGRIAQKHGLTLEVIEERPIRVRLA